MAKFDYQGARKEGYSDDEIKSFLKEQKPKYQNAQKEDSAFTKIGKNFSNFFGNIGNPTGRFEEEEQENPIDQNLLKKVPKFDVKGALQEGYTPDQINEFLRENQPEKSNIESGSRIASQYGLGALQSTPGGMAYDIATAPLASREAQNIPYRESLFDEREQLETQKASGRWNEKDQQFLDHINEQINDPEKSLEYAQASDLGIRGLAEKATGQNLHPEGMLEKAANWTGFIKDPKNAKNLFQIGLKPKDLTKAIFPGVKEILRGLSAGTALEMAEQNQFGPLGTIAAAIVGDVVGNAPGAITNVVKNPRQSAARFVNLVTRSNTKKDIIKQLSQDFEKAGMQIDAGTLTQSPLVQSIQARLVQSGLTGDALDNARKTLSSQVMREYENVVKDLGEISFENSYHASEAIKDALKVEEISLNIPKNQSTASRSLNGRVAVEEAAPYQQELLNRISPQEFENTYVGGQTLKTVAEDIKGPIKEEFNQRWTNLNNEIKNIESGPQAQLAHEMETFVNENRGSLLLGESTPEARVLRSAENLLNALKTPEGGLIGVSLENLIKTKRTLGDVANWEFGGSNFESAYKKLNHDISEAIDRTLEQINPELREQFQQLNAEYSQYKDAFESKNLKSIFEPKNENYNAIYNEFSKNPDKLRSLEDIFIGNPRGEQVINQVKRDFAQKIVENPNSTPKEIRNLLNTLGPQHNEDVARFLTQRQHAMEHPLPRIARQEQLQFRPTTPNKIETNAINPSRVKETGVARANESVRKKMYENISKKSPEQIMKQMESVKGIRELKRVLELTEEGSELFKELSRYKMAEMIDNKMKDNLSENVKLGTFSNLLKSKKNKDIARELLGKQSYQKLILLQKNAAQLTKSAEKFFNASKSGTTLMDMGLVGTAATGVLTGNPFLALPALAKIGGSYLMASLFADPKFIKELEKAILTNNSNKVMQYLENMKPSIQKAILDSKNKDQLGALAKPQETEKQSQ